MADEGVLIKKALKEDQLVFGTDRTVKLLKQGQLKKVYYSINCPESLVAELEHYGKLAGVEVVRLNKPNNELGTFCKKPFSINVLGLR
ncbi:MAG: ribosomal L7Ae/L30e/S12e/Gadd45 family protein [Nanoarchaeota archaeon]|nr:ribosomal L7Ae/L30e/S12e/Gadd45 family protein [Nanoarchaeota archaeon]